MSFTKMSAIYVFCSVYIYYAMYTCIMFLYLIHLNRDASTINVEKDISTFHIIHLVCCMSYVWKNINTEWRFIQSATNLLFKKKQV